MTKITSNFPSLSQPAISALHHAGYTTLAQLSKVTEDELLALHGFGPKGIVILRALLKAEGKSFAKPK